MQQYVASRPMFMDLTIINKDVFFALGTKEEGGCKNIPKFHKALSIVYSKILGTNLFLFSIFFYLQLFFCWVVLQ
jgi:hypothetical protein